MADGLTFPHARGGQTVASNYTIKAGESHDIIGVTIMALEEVNAELDAELQDAIFTAGKTARSYLRSNSPRSEGGGEYARDWATDSSGRDGHYESIVHNRKHYQLTHLLTDGHDIKNRKGGPSYGFVGPAQPVGFLDEAVERGNEVITSALGVR